MSWYVYTLSSDDWFRKHTFPVTLLQRSQAYIMIIIHCIMWNKHKRLFMRRKLTCVECMFVRLQRNALRSSRAAVNPKRREPVYPVATSQFHRIRSVWLGGARFAVLSKGAHCIHVRGDNSWSGFAEWSGSEFLIHRLRKAVVGSNRQYLKLYLEVSPRYQVPQSQYLLLPSGIEPQTTPWTRSPGPTVLWLILEELLIVFGNLRGAIIYFQKLSQRVDYDYNSIIKQTENSQEQSQFH